MKPAAMGTPKFSYVLLPPILKVTIFITQATRKGPQSPQSKDMKVVPIMKPIGSSGMWRTVKLRIREAGGDVDNVRVHDFRHYFVTCAYVASGGDIKFTQEVARHANIQTTSRYAHLGEKIDQMYDEIFNKKQKEAAS